MSVDNMGSRNDLFCVMVLLILYEKSPLLGSLFCDEAKVGGVMEGNFGQSGLFPWLGVLRVHLHEGDSIKIALTGIVLIKDKYALGNADDVAKVPRNVLREDSKAMFIPQADKPWFSPVENIVTHPEHDYRTVNTVVIIELKLEYNDRVPFAPICWPKYSLNTSDQLYAIGYTDDNKLLEKQIFKVQYVKQKHCDEFYVRADLVKNMMKPVHVQCAFAERSESTCVWDTGMVLVSNATEYWTMVGLGIRGPGCAAPARFIDFTSYKQWVNSAIEQDQISDYRRASKTRRKHNYTKPEEEIEDVPLDETSFWDQMGTDAANSSRGWDINTFPYHAKIENEYFYSVDRIDKDAIFIQVFEEKFEMKPHACEELRQLVYYDKTMIVADKVYGQAAYRLSVHDMIVMGYSCVKVEIKSLSRSKAMVWWMPFFDKYEGTAFKDMGYLPKELLKVPAKVNDRLSREPIRDLNDYKYYFNLNILVKFVFVDKAILHVHVYGPPRPPPFLKTPMLRSSKNIWELRANQSDSNSEVTPYPSGLNLSTLQNQNDSFDNMFVKLIKSKDDSNHERRFHKGRRLIDSKHRLRIQKANKRKEEREKKKEQLLK